MQTYCGAEGIIAGLRRCGATLNGISGAARIGRNVVVYGVYGTIITLRFLLKLRFR